MLLKACFQSFGEVFPVTVSKPVSRGIVRIFINSLNNNVIKHTPTKNSSMTARWKKNTSFHERTGDEYHFLK